MLSTPMPHKLTHPHLRISNVQKNMTTPNQQILHPLSFAMVYRGVAGCLWWDGAEGWYRNDPGSTRNDFVKYSESVNIPQCTEPTSTNKKRTNNKTHIRIYIQSILILAGFIICRWSWKYQVRHGNPISMALPLGQWEQRYYSFCGDAPCLRDIYIYIYNLRTKQPCVLTSHKRQPRSEFRTYGPTAHKMQWIS